MIEKSRIIIKQDEKNQEYLKEDKIKISDLNHNFKTKAATIRYALIQKGIYLP